MNNTIIAVDNSGSYRVYLTLSTDMVQEAVDIHGCSHTAAAALGRTITAAGLMGLMLKGENDKLTVQIKGDGPAREILASANSRGEVKGYISDPGVELPLTESGKLNVSGAIGNGTLTVIKDLGLKEPYVGRIDLVSGEIAEDFTQYFMASEQQPSSVALGVRMNSGKVEGAAGMIIQVLPDASDE
ncbi:MAG: Hsp33 family molecular chaperone HslO, partial [Firmicutes bacterium]|nr:Hsp33 family molecular chaperone HslO [Bacillota bacterium]